MEKPILGVLAPFITRGKIIQEAIQSGQTWCLIVYRTQIVPKISHSVLNWAQAKANLWKIHTRGWVRSPSSLSSEDVLVSSLCLGCDCPHGFRALTGVTRRDLGLVLTSVQPEGFLMPMDSRKADWHMISLWVLRKRSYFAFPDCETEIDSFLQLEKSRRDVNTGRPCKG